MNKDRVREAAQVEIATIQAELDYMNQFDGSPTDRLTLGRQLQEAQKELE